MRDVFRDDHVRCVLIVEGDDLLAVVERPDLGEARPEELAVMLGRLRGRTIEAGVNMEQTRMAMLSQRRHRLAVVDGEALLGLLGLKRTGRGFCSDADVQARAEERECQGVIAEAEKAARRYQPSGLR